MSAPYSISFSVPNLLARLAILLGVVLCISGSTSWKSVDGTTITSIVIVHAANESVMTIRADGPLSFPNTIQRVKRGWNVHLGKVAISEDALDVSALSQKLACSYDARVQGLNLTIVSSYDTLIGKRSAPNVLTYVVRKKSQAHELPTAQVASRPTQKSGAWDLDVIVIDPGHGGQDAGAEGVNGAYEKNVVLSIGKKLREILAKTMPSTKVVMTRQEDVFIELYRRTEIANNAGGKLFVSIHCNSMPTKPHPAHGCETYILRPGRNDDAARVARRENASITFETTKRRYDGMTEDQIIVATMAQRSFVKLSESFASRIQHEMTSSKQLQDRGVSQAGFFVLVGASMPNVLVETGFLSNTTDAQYLASSRGQAEIAQSLARAINVYASEYKQSLQH